MKRQLLVSAMVLLAAILAGCGSSSHSAPPSSKPTMLPPAKVPSAPTTAPYVPATPSPATSAQANPAANGTSTSVGPVPLLGQPCSAQGSTATIPGGGVLTCTSDTGTPPFQWMLLP